MQFRDILAINDSTQNASELLALFEKYSWWQLCIAAVLVSLPAFWGWYREHAASKKIEELYNNRLADKDKEIERQAQRIKQLENHVLKYNRK